MCVYSNGSPQKQKTWTLDFVLVPLSLSISQIKTNNIILKEYVEKKHCLLFQDVATFILFVVFAFW